MNAVVLDDENNERQAAALALAALGLAVLPVMKGAKVPDPLLTAHGFEDATRDPAIISGWFSVKPRANIGVACGAEYGLVVLDVDVKNGARGMKTLNDLWIREPTLIANTPSGGLHLYFKHPRIALVPTLDGIDVKGAAGGGYVLAPPSTLPNGSYSWRDPEIPIAEFPHYLLDEMRADKRGADSKTPKVGPVASIKVPQGHRHARLIELGAVYRGKGLDVTDIETLLWEHARNFDPPFCRDTPEDVQEIQGIVRWYGIKDAPTGASRPLTVLTSGQLVARAAAEPDRPLLDPPLPEAGNLMVYGPAGGGKSHLALVIALALARGTTVLDWSTAAPVPVLFCDGEMPLGELQARMHQYLCGQPEPELLFWAAARAQDLEGDMPDLADVSQQARYLEAAQRCAAKVIVFDNLTCLRQTCTDNPENSVEAWQPIAAFIRRLNALGIAVIIVHHAAKSGSQRGSSAHVAVMDTVLKIQPPGEGQADPLAELDIEIIFEKHRRFGGEAAHPIRAKVIGDENGYAVFASVGDDPLVDDVVRLRKDGASVRDIARKLKRSKNGIQKAIQRARVRGLLPLTSGVDE